MQSHEDERLEDGRKRVVRHGHLPERKVITGIGAIPVKVPRARDRKANDKEKIIRFASQLLPPYVRRSKSIEAAIPYLYLKGISSGDFSQVMPVLLGKGWFFKRHRSSFASTMERRVEPMEQSYSGKLCMA